jgi:NADH-quinone oxidoreductase subunit H
MTVGECINDFATCLAGGGMNSGLADFIALFIGVLLVIIFPLLTALIVIWAERKFSARVQDRMGPNRVGPFGLLQIIPDAIKIMTKEDITPANAERIPYNIAPVLMLVAIMLIWVVIPFSPIHIGVDLEIGALYFVAVASLSTLAIIMAGWSSNNKYALLGAFRVVAQLVSYEVPLVLALLVPVMLAGTMRMQGIVEAQYGMWFIFMVPIAGLIFFIANQAEVGRSPFDLLEADSELVAGYNIEYSGMKFGMFYIGEFVHVFTNGVIMAVLFSGGWIGPGAEQVPLLGFIYLMLKATFWYVLALLIRNTMPRIRIDQLMSFNWKFMVPLSIVNLLMVAFVLKIMQEVNLAVDLSQPGLTFGKVLPMTIVLLLVNLAMAVGIMGMVRESGRRMRLSDEATAGESAHAGAAGN